MEKSKTISPLRNAIEWASAVAFVIYVVVIVLGSFYWLTQE